MTKLAIPENRKELFFDFERVAKERMLEDKDGATPEFVQKLLLDLISEIPAAAFDPRQPVDEGVVFFHGNVEEAEVVDFQHDLLRAHLNLDESIPITLNLSSVGGSVFAGLALISTIYEIQRKNRKVNVHVQGVAMSMGSVIAQVADYRTIEPSAYFMLHEVQYAMHGSTADHDEEMAFSRKLQDTLYRYYSARTGKPISYYQQKLKKINWYMDAEQALEEKLVDAIIPAPIYALQLPTARPRRSRKVD